MESQPESTHFDLDETAAAYRRYLEPYLFTPWAKRLVELAMLEPGDVVVDVAAGTGAVSRAAASAVGVDGRVTATDISAAMLGEIARHADAGASPITTQVSSAASLDLLDGSADVVLCQQGLQFMPDKPAVIAEILRVLRPGGRVGIAVWTKGPWLSPLDDYEEFISTHPVGGSISNVLPREQFRMLPAEVASLLQAGGFSEVVSRNEEVSVSWPSTAEEARGILGSPFGRRMLLQSVSEQDALIEELAANLGGEHITTSVIVTATKP